MNATVSKIRLISLLAILAIATSCVHEYPEGEGADPTEITVDINLKTNPMLTRAISRSPGDGFGFMYFIVEIYKGGGYDGAPVFRQVFSAAKDDSGTASISFRKRLHAGDYKVVAWAECSSVMDAPGGMFDSSDLSKITYFEPYKGSTEQKECYEARFDMPLLDKEWNSVVAYSEEMRMPVGGVEIISTDADAFRKKVESTRGDGFDFGDYSIRWSYDLYFPVGYNVYTRMPNKAETNIGFDSPITALDGSEASLGFDYAFVNGRASNVAITVRIIDKKSGETLNTYSGIRAAIERDKMVYIRGKFLTENRDAGVGIDPGFNGEIDIVIPD